MIDELADLSPIDRLVLKQLCGPWAIAKMAQAWDGPSAWASSRVTPGYCSVCGEDPIIGDDWVAVPYVGDNRIIEMDHPPGARWDDFCWNYDLPDGFTCAGMFYEVSEHSGNCQEKRMDGWPTCSAFSLSPNTSDDFADGWYFQFDTFQFNDVQCKAMVRPDATSQPDATMQETIPISQLFQSGYNCTGYCKVTIQYLVYKGTTPPP